MNTPAGPLKTAMSAHHGAGSVHYRVEDGVAVLTLEHPPVNALSVNDGMVQRLGDLFEAGEADPAVRAFVLLGAGPNFCGGADIKEFGLPYDRSLIDVPLLCPLMDRLTKPIVAALHGAVMGGGLELALACHYRLADSRTRLALPEVKLGVLPGAGGVQRVSRVLGAERALDFVVAGDPLTAEEALRYGLVDAVETGDVDAAAVAYARQLLAEGKGIRRVRDRQVALDGEPASFLAAARQRIASAWPGYPAPAAAVDCIEAALLRPFEEGIAIESRIFDALVMTPEAAALRHIFFAQRAAARIAGIGPDIAGRRIASVGIAGAGDTAASLAMSLAAAGLAVSIFDSDAAALARTEAIYAKRLDTALAKGRLTPAERERRLAQLATVTTLDGLGAADLIVEAASKDAAVSRRLFAELDRAAKPDAILAANGPSVGIAKLAAATGRPQSVVGLHFFTPAHVMRLVEVVRTPAASPDALVGVTKLARRMDKVPVIAADAEGLIGNHILYLYLREARFLAEEGATPAQVDDAMRRFGLPMGPFQVADLIGLDVGRNHTGPEAPQRASRIGELLGDMGRLGQASGAGYYDYRAGERSGTASPVVEAAIAAESDRLGIVRRVIADEEIVARLVWRIVIEAARLLEQDRAQRASDIDLVYVFGYGFPSYRGGPMFYADQAGLARVLGEVRNFEASHGQVWAPPALLVELAGRDGRFNG